MEHKYSPIEGKSIPLERLQLSTISEHGFPEDANGELNDNDDLGNGGSDLEGLLGRKIRGKGIKGRRWRGWVWIGCFSFVGVLVFSLLFSLLFFILAREFVPELVFRLSTAADTSAVSAEPISWLGWQEIKYMFVLYRPPGSLRKTNK